MFDAWTDLLDAAAQELLKAKYGTDEDSLAVPDDAHRAYLLPFDLIDLQAVHEMEIAA